MGSKVVSQVPQTPAEHLKKQRHLTALLTGWFSRALWAVAIRMDQLDHLVEILLVEVTLGEQECPGLIDDFHQVRGCELVINSRPILTAGHQVRLAKHVQVLGGIRLAQAQHRLYVTDADFPTPQYFEDCQAHWMPEGAEKLSRCLQD